MFTRQLFTRQFLLWVGDRDDGVGLAIENVGESDRGGSSQKNSGGTLPHQPFHHRVHFLRSPKPDKCELHIGLHLKSIISRVANSVTGNLTLRPVETKGPKGRERGGVLGRGQRAPSHQLGV